MDAVNANAKLLTAILERFEFNYVHIKRGDFELTAGTQSKAKLQINPDKQNKLQDSSVQEKQDSESSEVLIKSPLLGTFQYAENYQNQEQKCVKRGDTLGYVTVLDDQADVVADVDAVILRRDVNNDSFVEYGQTLFVLKPSP